MTWTRASDKRCWDRKRRARPILPYATEGLASKVAQISESALRGMTSLIYGQSGGWCQLEKSRLQFFRECRTD